MSKTEKKILSYIEARKDVVFLAAITILGILIRLSGKDFCSGDAEIFLLPWFQAIQENGGFQSLTTQIGNYGIPYQFLIAGMTYFPLQPLYLYKILSVIFDFALAWMSAKFVCQLKQSKSSALFALVYGAVLCLPTVALNSSVWAQCDSIYTFFLVATLYELYRERYVRAFCWFGFAFAFKLQAVFILPFLVIYAVTEKRFSLLEAPLWRFRVNKELLPPPRWGVVRRDMGIPFRILFRQSSRHFYGAIVA